MVIKITVKTKFSRSANNSQLVSLLCHQLHVNLSLLQYQIIFIVYCLACFSFLEGVDNICIRSDLAQKDSKHLIINVLKLNYLL